MVVLRLDTDSYLGEYADIPHRQATSKGDNCPSLPAQHNSGYFECDACPPQAGRENGGRYLARKRPTPNYAVRGDSSITPCYNAVHGSPRKY